MLVYKSIESYLRNKVFNLRKFVRKISYTLFSLFFYLHLYLQPCIPTIYNDLYFSRILNYHKPFSLLISGLRSEKIIVYLFLINISVIHLLQIFFKHGKVFIRKIIINLFPREITANKIYP